VVDQATSHVPLDPRSLEPWVLEAAVAIFLEHSRCRRRGVLRLVLDSQVGYTFFMSIVLSVRRTMRPERDIRLMWWDARG
jgi:hypothetical protein